MQSPDEEDQAEEEVTVRELNLEHHLDLHSISSGSETLGDKERVLIIQGLASEVECRDAGWRCTCNDLAWLNDLICRQCKCKM